MFSILSFVFSIFCDFCKRMKTTVSNYTIRDSHNPYHHLKLKKDGKDCDCDTIHPGKYELQAEVCTPENSYDIYNAVPEEFKERMGSGKPVSTHGRVAKQGWCS